MTISYELYKLQEEEMLDMVERSISLPPKYNLKFMALSRGDQEMMSLSSVELGSRDFQKVG